MTDISTAAVPLTDSTGVNESSLCPGCHKSVVNDSGGVVVAFGQSFFHVQCFRCAKCGNQVNADTNLLLLSDGSPICSNCSYNCNVCNQAILDEAIMTGDDSYHAHCFKCKVCKNLIEDMVFAKTSAGIYCMKCHNERVAKIRKHNEKKKELKREQERELQRARAELDRLAGDSPATPKVQDFNRDTRAGPSSQSRPFTPPSSSPAASPYNYKLPAAQELVLKSLPERNSSKRGSLRLGKDAHQQELSGTSSNGQGRGSPTPFSVTVAPPDSVGSRSASPAFSRQTSEEPRPGIPMRSGSASATIPSQLKPSSRVRMDSLPLPSIANGPASLVQGKKSRDDSSIPGDISVDANLTTSVSGLNVPNKGRADKRRSINPGLGLTQFTTSSSSESTHTVTPPSHSQPQSSHTLESPRTPSPLREFFSEFNSANGDTGLASAPPDMDRQGRTRAASSSTYEHPKVDPMRPPLRQGVTVDRIPPRTNSLGNPATGVPRAVSSEQGRMSPNLSASHANIRPQRSFDSRPRPSTGRNSGGSSGRLSPSSSSFDFMDRPASRFSDRSRPTSPASPSHRVDVPHSVESGTDTDAETDSIANTTQDGSEDAHERPPVPPPKEGKERRMNMNPKQLTVETARNTPPPDMSRTTSLSDEEDDVDVPVQRMSRTTYIAPALPPIRISMNAADFSDLLKSIDGPFKSLDQLSKLAEESEEKKKGSLAPTPPPTAASFLDSSLTKTPTTHSPFSSFQGVASPFGSPSLSPVPPDEQEKKMKNGAVQESTRQPGHSPNSSISSWTSSTPAKRSISDSSTPAINGESSRSSLDGRTASQPSPTRARSSSESGYYSQSISLESRSSLSTESVGHSAPRMTLTVPGHEYAKPVIVESEDLVTRRLQEVLDDASDRQASHVKLDTHFVQAILRVLEQKKSEHSTLKGKLDNIRRASQQYMDGLTVAQAEYDREVKAKRDAEAEVTRLRVLLSGQAARLSAITSEGKRAELQRQLSQELSDNLSGLERDVSKLKVERDLTMAEVEELSASKSSPNLDMSTDMPLSRTLSVRFDNIKSQYARELVPLTEQKETLTREIAELKALREQFMEETASLSARNEELAQLTRQYIHQMETAAPNTTSSAREKKSNSFDRPRTAGGTMTTSITTSSTLSEESIVKITKIDIPETPQSTLKPNKLAGFKWPGSKASKEMISAPVHAEPNRSKGREHNFVPLNVLRFARCDQCGDKMFGSQQRCSSCNISVHPRCLHNVQISCTPKSSEEPVAQIAPLPSMFGRDLIEQVQSDAKDGPRHVPIIVEKCIDAVEASALDLEGIYRKTGGSGQSKMITQLFERGDYASFDLQDSDRFNDICAVTSVLKSYFRQLPNPLLTYSLHDEFVAAASIRDPDKKMEILTELLTEVPQEHYETLKMLMLHLHRVMQHSEVNLMTARNLGVVFGPTLMRSRDAGAEFTDMGAKAMSVEWLVENAPVIFAS